VAGEASGPEHLDVLIVGAGLSGIGAAWHLKHRCPGKSFLVLEGRSATGGTWDLFRYPGIRSDSDMYTLGYGFRPWTHERAIAEGPVILDYIRDTARESGIEPHILLSHRVRSASWCSAEARWTVEVERGDTGESVRFTCSWLHICSGYYDYAEGHRPGFAGEADFAGQVVHPQIWPEELDHANKRVVVIGSGATAVTLVPALARTAAHVTMLQRSPSYIVSLASADRIAAVLRRLLPARLAYRLVRAKNVGLQMLFYQLARRRPAKTRDKIVDLIRDELGPNYAVEKHFGPSYKPWDQRLCLAPDSDLFEAMRCGRASVVTDVIERFTPGGLKLRSGAELPADIVVTATGLKVQLLGGVAIRIDGQAADLSRALSYKGMMFSDVPNLSYAFGYTNASWTLKADLTSAYLCRLLARMERRKARIAIPRRGRGVEERPFVDFTSSYVQRAQHLLPKQGSTRPWRLHQNYALDLLALRFGRVEDGTLELS
jgi:cation diffusion facilitator CzcD-associated flavoprotein CzcO